MVLNFADEALALAFYGVIEHFIDGWSVICDIPVRIWRYIGGPEGPFR